MQQFYQFPEDFFERVVNIKWGVGDGVFAVGDWYGGVHYGDVKSKNEQDWSKTGTSMFGEYGEVRGSSFALIGEKPVFVIVGNFDGDGPPRDDFEDPPEDHGWLAGALIMVSNDGINWRHAMHKYSQTLFFTKNGVYVTHSLFGVVWTGSAFYASGLLMHDEVEGEPFDAPQPVKERIYTSSNGESWTKISETFLFNDDRQVPWFKDVPSGLSKYCRQPRNKGGIPDGLQGYDKENQIFMKPGSLNGYCIAGPLYNGQIHWKTTASSEVEIEVEEKGEIEKSTKSISINCYAVGYGHSLWAAAGGGGAVHLSFDRGEKWESAYGGGREKMLVISGAKRKDVIKDEKPQ